MAISQPTSEKWAAIERNSPANLPNRPSAAGLSAETIRNRLYKALLGDVNSLKEVITDLITDINTEIAGLPLSNYDTDAVTTEITHTLVDNEDYSYTATNVSVEIFIPDTVTHGFHSGLNFKSGASPVAVTFNNVSGLDLKILRYREIPITTYTPSANKTVSMTFYCDGINVYCYITEVA